MGTKEILNSVLNDYTKILSKIESCENILEVRIITNKTNSSSGLCRFIFSEYFKFINIEYVNSLFKNHLNPFIFYKRCEFEYDRAAVYVTNYICPTPSMILENNGSKEEIIESYKKRIEVLKTILKYGKI